MNADSSFFIGATHEVCQDYAVAGRRLVAQQLLEITAQTEPYVILSDGCSSSADTDIGARLLVKAAQRLMLSSAQLTADHLPSIHAEAAFLALSQAKLIGLPPQAVDATLLTIHLCDGQIIVGCSGDGAVVFESEAGLIDIYSINYPSGYPLYPTYARQPERLRLIENYSEHAKEVKRYRNSSDEETFQMQESYSSDSRTEVLIVPIDSYKLAAVFSDGIHSFITARQTDSAKRVEAVPFAAPIKELIAFKSRHGSFVKRRAKRFQKDCQINKWQHLDDLAMGAMSLGD